MYVENSVKSHYIFPLLLFQNYLNVKLGAREERGGKLDPKETI